MTHCAQRHGCVARRSRSQGVSYNQKFPREKWLQRRPSMPPVHVVSAVPPQSTTPATAEASLSNPAGGTERTHGEPRGTPAWRGFRGLSYLTVGATYLLIVMGAIVRASGSGLGCP